VLLGRVLTYFSEHEAEEARPDRWRVHLGKDTDRRLKALREHLDTKLDTRLDGLQRSVDALTKRLGGTPGGGDDGGRLCTVPPPFALWEPRLRPGGGGGSPQQPKQSRVQGSPAGKESGTPAGPSGEQSSPAAARKVRRPLHPRPPAHSPLTPTHSDHATPRRPRWHPSPKHFGSPLASNDRWNSTSGRRCASPSERWSAFCPPQPPAGRIERGLSGYTLVEAEPKAEPRGEDDDSYDA
jgi:hypothetical protein